jgi:hypothetical protein
VGRAARRAAAARSRLPAILCRRRQGLEELLGRFDGSGFRLLLGGDRLPADRAELRVRSEGAATLGTCHHRGRCADRSAAVRAEVGAPHERCTARAARSRRSSAGGDHRRKERVELLQAFVERNELVAALDEEILAELVAAEHLQHQAAEIAEALLADTQERAALSAELAWMGE